MKNKKYYCPFCKNELSSSHVEGRKYCNDTVCNKDDPMLTKFYMDLDGDTIKKHFIKFGNYLLLNDMVNNEFHVFRRDSSYSAVFKSKHIEKDPFDLIFWENKINLILTFI